jgi:hypothetical protein
MSIFRPGGSTNSQSTSREFCLPQCCIKKDDKRLVKRYGLGLFYAALVYSSEGIRVLKAPAIIIERQLGHFEKVHQENAVDKTIEKRPDQPGGHFIYPPGSDGLHHADIIFLQSVRQDFN